MVERGEIINAWRKRRDSSGVLATLVRVEGSSYRRPGARLYIQAGAYTGSISGGCLEGEVARKAAWLTRAGAAVERYSTLFDNPFDETSNSAGSGRGMHAPLQDGEIPYGLGCAGVIDLLLEPIAAPETEALLLAFKAAQNGEIFSCATVLPSSGRNTFARIIFRQDGKTTFASAGLDDATLAQLSRLARAAKSPEITEVLFGGETREVFLEQILPPQRLVIFGAGEDARPLARMAHAMGWRVALADGRAWLAQPERFPEATQVIALREESGGLAQLELTKRDAVAMLTHSFEQDRKVLPQLLPLDLRYLGLLGARNRSQLLLAEAAQQLGWIPEECLRRVHAPIGLDLGGDSPEAVALTIVAEIQSVLHKKNAASRRMSQESFRLASSERPYVPMQCPLDDPPQITDEPLRPTEPLRAI